MVVTNDVLLYMRVRLGVAHGLETLYPDACPLKPLGVHLQPFVPPTPMRTVTYQGVGPLIPMAFLSPAPHYLCALIQIYFFLCD
jgi:hypothetical protein